MSSAGQIVGGAIGYFVGGAFPIGAALGAQIGITIGGLIDPPRLKTQHGPRLSDLTVQTSTSGAPIPRIYGTVATHGNVFWVEGDRLKESVKKTKSGGKGGGGQTTKTYSYSATFAVGLCKGPIAGVRRIWVGAKLIYDAGSEDLEAIIASNQAASGFKIYLGDETQLPNPRMQADKGVSNTPGYRGLAYIVFYDLGLAEYGNSLMGAQVKVEVVKVASFSAPSIVMNYAHPWTGRLYTSSAMHADPDGALYIFVAEGELHSGQSVKILRFYPFSQSSVHVSTISESIPNIHFDGWSDVPMMVSGRTNYIRFYGVQGLIRECYLVDANNTAQNINVYIRRGRALAIVGGISPQSGTVYDVSGATATLLFHTDTSSPRGAIHDIFIGQDLIYAFTISKQLTAYDSDFNEVWNVDMSAEDILLTNAVGGTDLIIRESASGEVYLKKYGDFWRASSSGYTKLGVVSGYPPNYEEYGGHHFLGGMWVNYISGLTTVSAPGRTVATTFDILSDQTVSLSSIIQSETLQSKLITPSDVNTSTLTDQVRGYRVSETSPIRNAINPLQAAWPFDVVQRGYQLHFVRRPKAPVATVDEFIGEFKVDREMDARLPRTVAVSYLDVDREYQ